MRLNRYTTFWSEFGAESKEEMFSFGPFCVCWCGKRRGYSEDVWIEAWMTKNIAILSPHWCLYRAVTQHLSSENTDSSCIFCMGSELPYPAWREVLLALSLQYSVLCSSYLHDSFPLFHGGRSRHWMLQRVHDSHLLSKFYKNDSVFSQRHTGNLTIYEI